MNKRYQLACICLGDCNVGKTTILNRAENNLNFNKTDYIPTIGIDCSSFMTEIYNKKITLRLWDVSGNPKYRFVASGFLRRHPIVLLMFDISNRKTFDAITKWKKWARSNTSSLKYFYLIGNKKDQKREVYVEEARNLCEELNMIAYYETSREDKSSIVYLMNTIICDAIRNGEELKVIESGTTLARPESYTGCPCM